MSAVKAEAVKTVEAVQGEIKAFREKGSAMDPLTLAIWETKLTYALGLLAQVQELKKPRKAKEARHG